METLLALLMLARPHPLPTIEYSINSCYESDKEYGKVIKIIRKSKKNYVYQIRYDIKWSKPFINSKSTIENVYTKLIECP